MRRCSPPNLHPVRKQRGQAFGLACSPHLVREQFLQPPHPERTMAAAEIIVRDVQGSGRRQVLQILADDVGHSRDPPAHPPSASCRLTASGRLWAIGVAESASARASPQIVPVLPLRRFVVDRKPRRWVLSAASPPPLSSVRGCATLLESPHGSPGLRAVDRGGSPSAPVAREGTARPGTRGVQRPPHPTPMASANTVQLSDCASVYLCVPGALFSCLGPDIPSMSLRKCRTGPQGSAAAPFRRACAAS
jgi:hypothetical protein